MAAKTNLIMTNDIQVTAREIDFVTRFERNWQHLRDILGIMRPIKKQPGAVLKSKYAEGTLQSGKVAEGEEIPYSKFTVKEKTYAEMTIEKYAKAVSIEAIKDHGYENAVQMTDDEFLFQLQTDVTGRFYDYLKTGTLTSTETTFQMALAMAKGRVENKFKQMHRNVTGVVGFVNILDVYEYLGAAEITIQNQFGFQYMKDFMGFNTIFLLSDSEIPRGQVIATPVENIVLYYVDPNESDFARAGLNGLVLNGANHYINNVVVKHCSNIGVKVGRYNRLMSVNALACGKGYELYIDSQLTSCRSANCDIALYYSKNTSTNIIVNFRSDGNVSHVVYFSGASVNEIIEGLCADQCGKSAINRGLGTNKRMGN